MTEQIESVEECKLRPMNGGKLFWLVALGVLAAGHGYGMAWTSDDAFISFRYALNFIRGDGLVFNVGEKVEGYTNFLWTIWIALGLKLGADAEAWANIWSIASYVGCILLLAQLAWKRNSRPPITLPIPIAAILGLAHRDLAIFATSGLETATFTLLAFAGYFVMVSGQLDSRRSALAGFLFALGSMTRPDGVLLGFVAGCFILGTYRRGALLFAAAFLLIWIPFMAWRVSYYGDIFPNTYYAKSAYLTWWSQGALYGRLYFQRYWLLLLLPASALLLSICHRRRPISSAPTLLAAAMAGSYSLYVIRTGGDFMFARFFIPVTPFLCVIAERSVYRIVDILPRNQAQAGLTVITVAAAGGIWLSPSPVSDEYNEAGIVDERSFYSPEYVAELEREAASVRTTFDRVPIKVLFLGGQARAMYRLNVPLAIEGAAGLTDHYVAHLPLKERGRPGHEKRPPLDYLIKREIDLVWPPIEAPKANVRGPLPYYYKIGNYHFQIVKLNESTARAIEAQGGKLVSREALLGRE